MKSLTSSAAVLLLCCASASGMEVDEPGLPLWEVGVAGASASTPAYPASDQRSTRTLALPYLLYRGEVLRADQSGIGARLLRTDVLEFDVGFALSLPARSDDVPARRGMPDLGSLIEFGPRLKINLARPTAGSLVRLEVPLRAVIEVQGGLRQRGWAFEPRLVFESRDALGKWNMGANLGLVLADAKLHDYFYSVEAPLATVDRPAYQARSGMMALRAGVNAGRKLGDDWRILGFVRYDNYAASANRASPLFQQNSGLSVGVGFAWTVGRSQARARN
jgi:outer membrane protein